ncbi:Caspase domain [Trypanosoma vivax]|nr:Caspase domain [Trypanosoma vivax]
MECARAAVGRGARPLHWHQLLRDIRAAVGLLQRREAGPRHAAEVRHAHHLCKHPCGRGRFPGPERPANTAQHSAALGVACAGCEAGATCSSSSPGHGTQTKALHDAAEEFDQCLLPVDYEKNGCILDNDIHKVLLSRLPAGVRLTAVFDCCHSGTMMDLAFKYACSASSAPQCGGHMERIPRGERREGGCADGVRLRRRPDVRRRARHGNSGHGIHGRGRCDHSVPDVHDPEQDDGVIQRPVPRHARHAPSQRVHADPAAVRVQAAGPAATVFTDE